jgi:hypothetical protein
VIRGADPLYGDRRGVAPKRLKIGTECDVEGEADGVAAGPPTHPIDHGRDDACGVRGIRRFVEGGKERRVVGAVASRRWRGKGGVTLVFDEVAQGAAEVYGTCAESGCDSDSGGGGQHGTDQNEKKDSSCDPPHTGSLQAASRWPMRRAVTRGARAPLLVLLHSMQDSALLTAKIRRLIDLDRALQDIGLPGVLERSADEVALLEMHVASAERRRGRRDGYSPRRQQGGQRREVWKGAAGRLKLIKGGLSDGSERPTAE